jgi:polyisoprenoid-binding protein YceI
MSSLFSYCIALSIIAFTHATPAVDAVYEIRKATISFKSTAPEENISAKSTALSGILNLEENRFAFSVLISSFQGFNSELQRTHFMEDFMENEKFPNASFNGKLVDKFDATLATQKVRAKGQLEIHGVKKERIIEVEITKSSKGYNFNCSFNCLLADHGIRVPKVVFQKIAQTIKIDVNGEMVKQ